MTIEARIKKLQVSFEKLMSVKKYRIKSKVQTYDIRDCDQYIGVLELEQILRHQGSDIFSDELQRQTSTVVRLVSNIRKRSFRFDDNGKPRVNMHGDSETESLQSSDLDDILLDNNTYDDDRTKTINE